LGPFLYKNGSIDLVRGLFSSYDIGTYILTTCMPLNTFLGPFWGAQMPQNSIKNCFLVVLNYFSYKNGPIDLVRGFFSSLDIGTNNLLNWVGFGLFWGCPNAPNSIKNYFLVLSDYFSYENRLINLVRGPFSS
jgi:hypothetical protein